MGFSAAGSRLQHGYLPLALRIADRRVLVVGGGKSSLSAVRRLLDFGAMVDVISVHMSAELQEMALVHGTRLSLKQRQISLPDEDEIAQRKFLLIVACSANSDENEYIVKLANDAGTFVCAPDSTDSTLEASAVMPSIRKRGHIKIAVSTDGVCPVLSRVLLERIESSLGGKIDKYVLFVESYRERMTLLDTDLRGKPDNERRLTLKRVAESEELVLALQRENFDEAMQLLELIISENQEAAPL